MDNIVSTITLKVDWSIPIFLYRGLKHLKETFPLKNPIIINIVPQENIICFN